MQLKIGAGCGSVLRKAVDFILGKVVDLFLERLWTYFSLRLCLFYY
jgi:hypothetical protein